MLTLIDIAVWFFIFFSIGATGTLGAISSLSLVELLKQKWNDYQWRQIYKAQHKANLKRIEATIADDEAWRDGLRK